jgi:myosin heavy subunit
VLLCVFFLFIRTKIFTRDYVIAALEKLRSIKLQEMDKAATLLQATYRMSIQRKRRGKAMLGQ